MAATASAGGPLEDVEEKVLRGPALCARLEEIRRTAAKLMGMGSACVQRRPPHRAVSC